MSGDLIDTTEMYLRTIVELMEEGAPPLRARIAERLHQSSPTVSQTVARMERDGLLTVTGDRTIELSPAGLEHGTRVMRRHRLAERMLTDMIGIPLDLVHDEACRWEHVISDAVERRLVEILDHPTETPYGTPIPGLADLGEAAGAPEFLDGVAPLDEALGAGPATLVVRRLSENIQRQEELLSDLVRAGVLPGVAVRASRIAGGVELVTDAGRTVLPPEAAADLYVEV